MLKFDVIINLNHTYIIHIYQIKRYIQKPKPISIKLIQNKKEIIMRNIRLLFFQIVFLIRISSYNI